MALALTLQSTEEAWIPFHRYLAQHQMPDGSWGGKPASCVCPEAPTAPPPLDPVRVAALIQRLGDEAFESRTAAEAELAGLGLGVLPALRKGCIDPDAERRARCADLVDRLSAACTGAGDVETTGLVLLTFLSAGYSHLSRDQFDGLVFGQVVKKGFQWLLARQDKDGRFDAFDGTAHAVAALALCEGFGLTASIFLKDGAQRAVKAVEASIPDTARGLAWAAEVALSARASDVAFDPAFAERLLDALQEPRSTLARVARLNLLLRIRKETDVAEADLLALAPPSRLNPEVRHFVATALHELDGRKGRRWNSWNPRFLDGLPPLPEPGVPRCERGAREGGDLRSRLRATVFQQLSRDVCYRREYGCGCKK